MNKASSLPYLTPETKAHFDSAFPLLLHLRDEQKVIEGEIPKGRVFEGEQLSIKPFYMDRLDDHDLGVWQVNIGSFAMRITSIHTMVDGVDYRITVKPGEDAVRKPTPEEVQPVAALLNHINDQVTY